MIPVIQINLSLFSFILVFQSILVQWRQIIIFCDHKINNITPLRTFFTKIFWYTLPTLSIVWMTPNFWQLLMLKKGHILI